MGCLLLTVDDISRRFLQAHDEVVPGDCNVAPAGACLALDRQILELQEEHAHDRVRRPRVVLLIITVERQLSVHPDELSPQKQRIIPGDEGGLCEGNCGQSTLPCTNLRGAQYLSQQ